MSTIHNTKVKEATTDSCDETARVAKTTSQVLTGGIELHTMPIAVPTGWPTLPETAFYGPLGHAVKEYAPYSEADPAAVLISLLTQAGVLMGRNPHLYISDQVHRANLFTLLIGPTSLGRKGTAGVTASRLLGDGGTVRDLRGLGSGEAVVARLADPAKEGACALLMEEEFARVLEVARRNGSTLSAFIRMLFDGRPLSRLNVDEEQLLADYHVGVIGHITPHELGLLLSENDQVNGLANRFLMVASHARQRVIWFNDGTSKRSDPLTSIGKGLATKALAGRTLGRIALSKPAKQQLVPLYLGGRFDGDNSLTARMFHHLCRVVLILAVMDGGACVKPAHINAALDIVRYCEDTVEMVFPNSALKATAERVYRLISSAGTSGVTLSELATQLSNHVNSDERGAIVDQLKSDGLVISKRVPSFGRTATRLFACDAVAGDTHTDVEHEARQIGTSK